MAYFSIPLELVSTIYIQAHTLVEAAAKLQEILKQPLVATDLRWFSDASFGSRWLPELSFATAMRIVGPKSGANFEAIDLSGVHRQMQSNPEGNKSKVIPHSQDTFGCGVTPIYWADLDVTATGILEAVSIDAVKSMEIADLGVHWELADEWFTLAGFDKEELPIILSPNMTVEGIGKDIPLRIRWDGN
ncbi:hypothetical protein G6L29_10545 [Agrobacterium rhizogenes]|uniref:hypothetical protein n=1 Tax=Rhizobium rhizogenes TaxID=359 RepID=UPI001571C399|nr:hypothetical protein [Rhizobium rhizogenes]NTI16074.1 hypothetical protein [Rhizobium rhizogenes]